MTKLLKEFNKYNDLLIQSGGAFKYESQYKIWIDNTNKNDLTGCLYFQFEIDKNSVIGKELNDRKTKSKSNLDVLLGKNIYNTDIIPHITVLEIYFDISSNLGKTITDYITNNQKKEIISNIVKTAFNTYLLNNHLYSQLGNYEKLGNFFTREYNQPQNKNAYSNFKKYIYIELCKLINYDITTTKLNNYSYKSVNTKTNNNLNFNIFFTNDKNNTINYAISDYFYEDGWKPHLSIMKFNDDINQNKFNEVINIFKSNTNGKSLSHINLWPVGKQINNHTGTLSKIKVTLNHPNYNMYQHSIDILL